MGRAIRVIATVVVLLVVWVFRGTRLATLFAAIAGAWLRRVWVTGPTRTGTLGRKAGAPRWVRAASGRVAGRSLAPGQQHSGSLFDPDPPKQLPGISRWW
jgi:hypothetical protein